MAIPVEDYPLQINDVITHIGALDVSNSGQVETTAGRSVSCRYAIDQSVKDGKLSVQNFEMEGTWNSLSPSFMMPSFC